MIKILVHQENVSILNLYVPDNILYLCIKTYKAPEMCNMNLIMRTH